MSHSVGSCRKNGDFLWALGKSSLVGAAGSALAMVTRVALTALGWSRAATVATYTIGISGAAVALVVFGMAFTASTTASAAGSLLGPIFDMIRAAERR